MEFQELRIGKRLLRGMRAVIDIGLKRTVAVFDKARFIFISTFPNIQNFC